MKSECIQMPLISNLNIAEKNCLINALGSDLEFIGQILHDDIDMLDETFFEVYYRPLRDVIFEIQAEYNWITKY